MEAEADWLGARDARGPKAFEVSHFFFGPDLYHAAGVGLVVAVPEAVLACDVAVAIFED